MSICKQSGIKNEILLLKCIYLCKIDTFFIILISLQRMYGGQVVTANHFAVIQYKFGKHSRRATAINTYSTATNSYSFTELDTNKRYIYRVRSIGEENTYSQWSEEKTFEFGTTGIKQKNNSKQQAANIPIYNLSGQRVGANFKGLVVKEGKKFMNK